MLTTNEPQRSPYLKPQATTPFRYCDKEPSDNYWVSPIYVRVDSSSALVRCHSPDSRLPTRKSIGKDIAHSFLIRPAAAIKSALHYNDELRKHCEKLDSEEYKAQVRLELAQIRRDSAIAAEDVARKCLQEARVLQQGAGLGRHFSALTGQAAMDLASATRDLLEAEEKLLSLQAVELRTQLTHIDDLLGEANNRVKEANFQSLFTMTPRRIMRKHLFMGMMKTWTDDRQNGEPDLSACMIFQAIICPFLWHPAIPLLGLPRRRNLGQPNLLAPQVKAFQAIILPFGLPRRWNPRQSNIVPVLAPRVKTILAIILPFGLPRRWNPH
ncbi:hypothetical protein GALMADRAFT_217379 [Galerina marginata CBS 339.88]|uniref:Uncharacterized protein n=1 Tax=Galerina marginata (strain CBS 339.88) TaxID=685588 RepID=A0A067SDG6_GALM3|nr:hypothetical protein GALMADRAFT_217379 [Galerina marginata CBS 339.88]